MIYKLLATTALAALVASGAYAQDTTTPTPTENPTENPTETVTPAVSTDGNLATNIVGENVYNGTGDDAESIGEVSDIVFDKDGQATKLVIGVGGFLGVGTKNVAFDYSQLKWAEKDGDRWLVAETSKDALKALPAFDETPYEPAPASQAPTDANMQTTGTAAPNSTAMAPADTATPDATAPAPADTNNADNMTAPAVKKAPAGAAATSAMPAEGMLASNVIGDDVYNGTGDNAEKIGSISDIVLNKEGLAEQIILDVGGFLGVGTKSVAVAYNTADWTEKGGDRWLVVQTTKEKLKGLPAFDRKAYDPKSATSAANSQTPAIVPSVTGMAKDNPANGTSMPVAENADQTPAADNASDTDAMQKTTVDKSTLTEVPSGKISADNLIGTTVYGEDDATVGEISDVVLSSDKKVDAIVVDVGGFLGIGSKPVAVGMDKLKFMTDKDGNQYLYTNLTKDQLEAQVAYDKGSYAEKRDEQRLIVQ